MHSAFRQRVRLSVLPVLLSLLVPALAAAQPGTVSGTVTSASTPLADVRVDFYNVSEQLVASATPTNAAGAYSISTLAAGTYYAFAYAGNVSGNYVDVLYPATPCLGPPTTLSGTYCRVNTGAPIVVTAGGTTAGVNFDVPAGGTVSGTITAAGTPYPGAVAELHLDIGGPSSLVRASAATDASGAYQLSRIPAGAYYVWAGNVTGGPPTGFVSEFFSDVPCPKGLGSVPTTGPGCSLAAATPIPVSAGAVATTNFDLAVGGAISGTTFGAGSPRFGLGAFVSGVGGATIQGNASSLTGAFLIRGLPPGTYGVTGFGSGYSTQAAGSSVTVSAGAITAGPAFDLVPGFPSIPFDYQPQSRTVLSGQTVTLSAPAVGQAPLSYQWYQGQSGNTAVPVVGATGTDFTTPPITFATSYWVRVSNGLGFTDSTTANLTLATAGTGAISGTITSTSQPVANATVSIFSSAEVLVASSARTSASGAFSVAGLAPGTYYAFASYGVVSGNVSATTVAPAEFPYADVLYPNTPCAGVQNTGTYCRITSGAPITVTAGAVTAGVDFNMPVGGAITGQLTLGGQIPPGPGTAQVGLFVDASSPLRTGHLDPLGTLVLPRLPVGNYRITASAQGMTSEVWDDVPCPAFNCLSAGGAPILVAGPGAVTGKNFDLAPAPPPPLITTQPQPQAVANGQSATLSVTAGGTGPFFYQWYRGFPSSTFDPVVGATSPTLTTGPLTRGEYQYWVRISNYGGFVDSAVADVAVGLGRYRR